MTTWNDRLLPYPLLAPWTDDYSDAIFVANVPHAVLNNGEQITLTIKYHCTSQILRELVTNGQARYVALVGCPKTFSRDTFETNQDDDVQVLDADGYAGELKLTPYIIATQLIDAFISGEHAEEIRDIKPEGFDIPPGSILAVGDSTDITLEEGGSPYSIIDLVANSDPKFDQGSFHVALDDRRIKIHVAPHDKERIEALRRQEERRTEVMAVFFPAVYLHAITEALRNLSTPEYQDKDWTHTMLQALERNGIAVDDEDIKDNALKYAQTLMEKPVGALLTAFSSREEE